MNCSQYCKLFSDKESLIVSPNLIYNHLKASTLRVVGNENYSRFLSLIKSRQIRSLKWIDKEVELIPSLVNDGESCIDVGANYGMYTFHLSRSISAGTCYSFEPVSETHFVLSRVIKLLKLKNVKLFKIAASNEEGEVKINIPLTKSGIPHAGLSHLHNQSFDRKHQRQADRYQHFKLETIKTKTLDSMIPANEKISLIKLDIEGAELLALQGARKILENHSPSICIELSTYCLETFGITKKDVADYLLDLGYQIYKVSSTQPRKLFQIQDQLSDKDHVLDSFSGNFYFLHPSKADRYQHLIQAQSERKLQ